MLPVLYSFRRCPYAMRARLAIQYSGIPVELREIVLRNKPAQLLQASPKGTVPVLILPDGQVIEQSRDIMLWALNQSDPDNWFCRQNPADQSVQSALIDHNDQIFKKHLDQYKYPERYPAHSQSHYQQLGGHFLQDLEQRLQQTAFLMNEQISMADMALFPFIRQFAAVDPLWFNDAPWPKLKQWLDFFCTSSAYQCVMQKFKPWQTGADRLIFP